MFCFCGKNWTGIFLIFLLIQPYSAPNTPDIYTVTYIWITMLSIVMIHFMHRNIFYTHITVFCREDFSKHKTWLCHSKSYLENWSRSFLIGCFVSSLISNKDNGSLGRKKERQTIMKTKNTKIPESTVYLPPLKIPVLNESLLWWLCGWIDLLSSKGIFVWIQLITL